jgi:hypothetical protein
MENVPFQPLLFFLGAELRSWSKEAGEQVNNCCLRLNEVTMRGRRQSYIIIRA